MKKPICFRVDTDTYKLIVKESKEKGIKPTTIINRALNFYFTLRNK